MSGYFGVDSSDETEEPEKSESTFPFSACNDHRLKYDTELVQQSLHLSFRQYVRGRGIFENVDAIQDKQQEQSNFENPLQVEQHTTNATNAKAALRAMKEGGRDDETKAVVESLINETMKLEGETDKSISNYVINSLLQDHEFSNLRLAKSKRLSNSLKTSLKRRVRDLYIDTYLEKAVYSFVDDIEDQFLLLSNNCRAVSDPGWFQKYCDLFKFENDDYLNYDMAFFMENVFGASNMTSGLSMIEHIAQDAFCLNLVHFMATYSSMAKSAFNLMDFDQFDSSSDEQSILSINRRHRQECYRSAESVPKIKFDVNIYVKTFDQREPPHIVYQTAYCLQ